MNFNLISPDGNGHTFNVRYNDPIVIPSNSSVSLNWAQFERGSSITFTEDQFFTYVFDKVTPDAKLADGTAIAANTSGNLTFRIKSGTYTCEQLMDEMCRSQLGHGNDKIFCGFNQYNRDLTNITEGVLTNHSTDVNCKNYEYIIPRPVDNGHSVVMGICKHVARVNEFGNITANAGTGRKGYYFNADGYIPVVQPAGPLQVEAYTSTSTAAGNVTNFTNNSFIISREKYFHVGFDLDTYNRLNPLNNTRVNNADIDEFRGANVLLFRLNQIPTMLQGRVFVGFACEENSGIAFGTEANHGQKNNAVVGAGAFHTFNQLKTETYHNTAQNTDDLLPQSLGGLVFSTTGIKVVGASYNGTTGCATAATGNPYGGFTLLDAEYEDLGITVVGATRPLFGIQIYRPNSSVLTTEGNTQDPMDSLYVRCFYINNAGAASIFFDSDYAGAKENWVFTKDFQNQYRGANGDTEAKRRSQIPFNVLAAATFTGEGVEQFIMDEIQDRGGGDSRIAGITDYESHVIVEEYHIEATRQFARLFQNVNQETTALSKRYPSRTSRTIVEAMTGAGGPTSVANTLVREFYNINQLIAQYRLDRFTVYCNQLPIKVYQNTQNKGKSGNRRNILSNIPNPFAGASVFDEGEGEVIGSYVPSLGITNFLGNQMTTTNNFDIQIRNMDDDTPAAQLTKSVINFTITPPQQ